MSNLNNFALSLKVLWSLLDSSTEYFLCVFGRDLIFKGYTIIYKVEETEIKVLDILSGKIGKVIEDAFNSRLKIEWKERKKLRLFL